MDRKLLLIIVALFVFGFVYHFDRWGQRAFVNFTMSSVAPLKEAQKETRRSSNEFPKNFLIGTSSSAYQIEGGWNEDGKSASIWDDFVHSIANAVVDNTTADIGPDSYHNYKEDIRALKLVGVRIFLLIMSDDAFLIQSFFFF